MKFMEKLLLRAGAGYPNYRIPGIVATARGTLLAVAEARLTSSDWADMDAILLRSVDGGENWSAPTVLGAGIARGSTANNPTLLATRSGAVFVFYCERYGVAELGGGIYYRVSLDDGVSWSTPVDTSAACRPEYHVAFATGPTHGIETRTGALIVPVWMVPRSARRDLKSHHPSVVSSLYSVDGGANWQMGELITAPGLNDPSETIVAEVDRGVMFNMRNESGRNRRAVAFSATGYSGWSEVIYDETLIDPVCNAGMVCAHDGVVLFVNPASTTSRERGCVRMSLDGGRSWPVSRVLREGSSAYSDIATTSDGWVHVLLETEPGFSITYYRFERDWLLGGK